MEDGKLSLDLLMGLSIFLFTFIFVANFLPGVFADVRNEISLANQAYRISALLVEDPGYNSTWFMDINPDNCRGEEYRPGLASYVNDTTTVFNKLEIGKIEKLAELLSIPDCRERVKFLLGLNLSEMGGQTFKFNVSLRNLSGELITKDGNVLLNHGDILPNHGDIIYPGQIVKFERIVYLSQMVDNCHIIAERCVAKLEVVVWI